jgi:UDP-hydrolysing UDP-N-acetyl-D-glucosamine 2-epimerase
MKRKIAFFTSTRADYGILRPLMKAIFQNSDLECFILAGGTHFLTEYGDTSEEILKDGLKIYSKMNFYRAPNDLKDITTSYGLAVQEVSGSLDKLRPDLFVVLGDRFETLAATSSAVMFNIPVVHIHGGEISCGAQDELFRHAITKLSHHHLVSTEAHRRRVVQMGEQPENVINIGSLSLESVEAMDLLTKQELLNDLKIKTELKLVLTTFHPETLASVEENHNMLSEVISFIRNENSFFLITKANADFLGNTFNDVFTELEKELPSRVKLVSSLGQRRYFSCMRHFDLILGNSSSGIIEAPFFQIPTINVGERQKGRERAASVVDVKCESDLILKAFKHVTGGEFKEVFFGLTNPYYKKNSSGIALEYLKKCDLKRQKKFFEVLNG